MRIAPGIAMVMSKIRASHLHAPIMPGLHTANAPYPEEVSFLCSFQEVQCFWIVPAIISPQDMFGFNPLLFKEHVQQYGRVNATRKRKIEVLLRLFVRILDDLLAPLDFSCKGG